MIPPVLSCCGFSFQPDVVVSNSGCDWPVAESQMTEKDPKFSRTLFARGPASAATPSDCRDLGVLVPGGNKNRNFDP